MEISGKLDILDQLYDMYDSFSTPLGVACVRGCAACCTQNVTMTTLEGYRIVSYLHSTRQTNFLARLQRPGEEQYFRPALTTNELAALCMHADDPPEEKMDWPFGSCPFLSNNECLIYSERPFGCRCFFSTQKCDSTAYAVLDPFLVTVNTVFLQFIEHVDAGGLFGNMTDILLFLRSDADRKRYEENARPNRPVGLPVNRRVQALSVPPEHQSRIKPMLQKIKNIRLFEAGLGNDQG